MKLVTAIIKPFKLQEVKEELEKAGLTRMTLREVKGIGRQKGHTEVYRGSEYTIEFQPKMEITIALEDEQLDTAIETIRKSAATNSIGDGKIFVVNLEQAIRIRTGETGVEAL